MTRTWQGVRMRTLEVEGDDAPRRVTLPAAWDDAAAAALCGLVPGTAGIAFAAVADAWIRPLAEAAHERGIADPLAERLHALLLSRRGAPAARLWRRQAGAPSFVLNLAQFHHPATGFDAAGFGDAIETAVLALSLAEPVAERLEIAISGLAGLLAALGLAYDSDEGRCVAANIAALLRGRADATSARFAPQGMLISPDWRLPPPSTVLPGLNEAVREARGAMAPHHVATTAVLPPGPADALLGVETSGIAPAFSPLADDGTLTRTARAWLAAQGLSVEAALAAMLANQTVFPAAGPAAHAAMHQAMAPYIQSLPRLPAPRAVADAAQALPNRRGGYSQQANLGGHRLVLRTGEFQDGRLAEISLSMPKESAAFRGLLDGFAHAVSLGLQHGMHLESFVDAFTLTRFGPAGAVEGDAGVAVASSPLDYAFRSLAATYLGGCDLPEATLEEIEPPRPQPVLPLDLPQAPRAKRHLRLV